MRTIKSYHIICAAISCMALGTVQSGKVFARSGSQSQFQTPCLPDGEDHDTRWGDLGNGTYANPILNGDYSDPDVIRVGDKYYMVCSEFHFMGMPVLESDDMVNWKIIGQIFNRMDMDGYSTMSKYGGGSWAPALRYHNGKFWMYVCTPHEGLFMSTATRPEGPWEPLVCVKSISGWEDPCPFWDEDGQGYIGRSQLGGGPIYLHKMSADGKQLLDNGVKIYEGPTAEGTKIFKKDGYYYLSIPEGGVGTGWQTVMRSERIYGPYNTKRVLEMGSTNVNGPHQGALVDTPEGEWWFYHFQATEPQGRVVHLQPVSWKDGFPEIGQDYDGNGIGEPVKVHAKPHAGKRGKVYAPQASDEFKGKRLGVQWQYNHNPDEEYVSLTNRKGWLCIIPQKAEKLRMAKNQLTQKTMGFKGEATVKMDFSKLTEGGRMGMECIGNRFVGAGIMISEENGTKKPYLYCETDGSVITKELAASTKKSIYIRLAIDALHNKHQFYYSEDGKKFMPLGETFASGSGDWKGSRIGLYAYTTNETGGQAYFDDFCYKFDGPGGLQ
ncbi:MAG: glycoside hydrolase 43 family protein [Bacteroides sp.]|nr:glycoside hydrolase 43 family protein [Roseburia sp.]MCM1346132.1 glycoside hydrolase 43 family protein [Bacteroides sp.]MCM1422069.1 glycoside hydrolase 43 family protein [Bacteroides sp.]